MMVNPTKAAARIRFIVNSPAHASKSAARFLPDYFPEGGGCVRLVVAFDVAVAAFASARS